ncbi:MAG TPA: pyridoxamine 5'-phosphate oxidase family protein [Solirubrobacterales bacterium]|nr:pyridoxamine 5'-phosphate oxidase family protein [Solirubrobacterales bacterium]
MPSWNEFEEAAPELAERVRERLDAHVHKTIATLRKDGSPRISGTETQIREDELWIGSMPNALKAKDLQRDPRYSLHSGSDDPPGWKGDAKVSGLVEEITDPETVQRLNGHGPPGPSHLFRLEIDEASVVKLNEAGDGIIVTLWSPERGVREVRR